MLGEHPIGWIPAGSYLVTARARRGNGGDGGGSGQEPVYTACAVTSQAAPGMVTPPGEAYARKQSRTCLVTSAACAGLSPARTSVAVGEARSYSSTSSTSGPMSIGSSAFANSAPPNPVPLSSAPTWPVSAREKAADGPGRWGGPSAAAAGGNPGVRTGFSARVRQHRNASLPPRRSAFRRLPNAAAGSSKNMTPKLLTTTSKAPGWNG